jgi:hypothetical protein
MKKDYMQFCPYELNFRVAKRKGMLFINKLLLFNWY